MVSLKRLDRLGGMILHSLKSNDAVAWSLDVRLKNPELTPDAEGLDLVLDEQLDRLLQRVLDFPQTYRPRRLHNTALNKRFSKEVRLAGAASTVCAFVASRANER
jgi:hypothetical protein